MNRNFFNGFSVLLMVLVSGAWQLPARADDGPTPPTTNAKEWTFLVFLNGNNSLDSFASLNLNEMEKVGSTDAINVVVEWGSQSRGTTQRLLIKKDGDPNTVTSPVVQQLGKTDMGDWHSLSDFISWGVKNYPANHYFIEVWDHGMGWHDLSLRFNLLSNFGSKPGTMHPQDISLDESTGHSITTEDLGKVMAQAAQLIGHKVDLYGSDACLMGMAEVAGEMQDSVQTFVGSEEVEPAAGWPYTPVLQQWAANPKIDSQGLAKILVNEYVKTFSGGEHGTDDVTLSAFDLSALSDFSTAVGNFGDTLLALNAANTTKLQDAMSKTMRFYVQDYADFGDLMTQISLEKIPGLDDSRMTDVKAAANRLLIANGTTAKYAGADGISIWLPTASSDYVGQAERYNGLRFATDSRWGVVLKKLFNAPTPAPVPAPAPLPFPGPPLN